MTRMMSYLSKCGFLIAIAFFFATHLSIGQNLKFMPKNDVPVVFNGNMLTNPWAGGLNSVHMYRFPLDNDTVEDLLVFEKNGDKKIYTFLAKPIQGGTGYEFIYSPEYEPFMPIVASFIFVIDYNNDGKKDIFTRGGNGLEYFKNVTAPAALPTFQNITNGNAVLFKFPTTPDYLNLQISSYGYPEITDVDNDGDLDILIFDFYDGVKIEFYRNMKVENTLPADSLRFQMVTNCWGNIREVNRCDSLAFDYFCLPFQGIPDVTSTSKIGKPQHSGASLNYFDFDGDGDKDLFVCDIVCNDIKYVENKGTATQPIFDSFTNDFPPNTTYINMHQFPRLIFDDFDFDGKKDLFVSPNLFDDDATQANYSFSSWMYKNTDPGSGNNFQFIKSNFLQETMIDLGDKAYPFLEDYDQDGDLDLFIGNNYRVVGNSKYSSIFLFENTGTASNPSFNHISSDYLGLSSLDLLSIRPYFADINGDGKRDFVFSSRSKTNNTTPVRYLINQASSTGSPYSFNASQIQTTNLDLFSGSHLAFSDINNDGKDDILHGEPFGDLKYYRNDLDSFTLVTSGFMGLDGLTYFDLYMAPHVGDIDHDGQEDLLIGNGLGQLRIYLNFKANLPNGPTPIINILTNPFTGIVFEPNFGSLTIPVLGDLNNDSFPELLVGNVAGGITYYENQSNILGLAGGPDFLAESIDIYPNPAEDFVKVKKATGFDLELLNATGQRAVPSVINILQEDFKINTSQLPNGVYLLRFSQQNGGRTLTKKLVINR